MPIYQVDVWVTIPFEVEADDQYQAEENALEMWNTYLEVADNVQVDVYDENGEPVE